MKKAGLFLRTTFLVLLLTIHSAAEGAGTSSIQAKVSMLVGEVKIKTADGKRKKAETGAELSSGDMIITGVESKAEVLFNTGDLLVVGEMASVKMEIKENEKKGQDTHLNTYLGRLFVDVKKLARGLNQFSVSTPTATAAIRGTSFEVVVDSGGKLTEVSVIEGKVEVRDRLKNRKVLVHAKQRTRVRRAPEKPEKLPARSVGRLSKWVGDKRVREIMENKSLDRYNRRESKFKKLPTRTKGKKTGLQGSIRKNSSRQNSEPDSVLSARLRQQKKRVEGRYRMVIQLIKNKKMKMRAAKDKLAAVMRQGRKIDKDKLEKAVRDYEAELRKDASEVEKLKRLIQKLDAEIQRSEK